MDGLLDVGYESVLYDGYVSSFSRRLLLYAMKIGIYGRNHTRAMGRS